MIGSLLLGIGLGASIAGLAWWRQSLSTSGALAATVVGALVYAGGGWVWGVLLVLFFVTSTALSRLSGPRKRTAEAHFQKGHRRDLGQVLANGGLATALAVAHALIPSPVWFPLFVGALAAMTADTWATEIGTLSRAEPRLITTFRPVPAGTSGAISLLGTSAAVAGGTCIGAAAALLMPDRSASMLVAIGTVCGTVAALADSLLGATLQAQYLCPRCQIITETPHHACGSAAPLVRGRRWCDNDVVNWIASAAGIGAAWSLTATG